MTDIDKLEELARRKSAERAGVTPNMTLPTTTSLALVAECRELRRLRGALEFLNNDKRVRHRCSPESVYEIAASLGWKEGT